MPDSSRIVRQWLETDAAFGVTEVPIPTRQPTQVTVAKSAPAPVRPAVSPVAAPAPPRPVAAPAVSAAPATRSALIAGAEKSAKVLPAKKAVIAIPAAPAGDISKLPPITRERKEELLELLRQKIEAEGAPFISKICTRVVFGEGDPDAALMFVGEGPGAEEDRTGRPFVGRSGQLLDRMIAAIGYQRQQVYIGNVVKLRCADFNDTGRLQDRPPSPEEVARGLPYLHQQIEIIRPKVIVTLGAPAVKHLTGTTQGVMSIRGTWLQYRGIPVMPTYHPSFVLRAYTEENRRKVWSDLKEAVKRIKG